jgi:hypothetical protein
MSTIERIEIKEENKIKILNIANKSKNISEILFSLHYSHNGRNEEKLKTFLLENNFDLNILNKNLVLQDNKITIHFLNKEKIFNLSNCSNNIQELIIKLGYKVGGNTKIKLYEFLKENQYEDIKKFPKAPDSHPDKIDINIKNKDKIFSLANEYNRIDEILEKMHYSIQTRSRKSLLNFLENQNFDMNKFNTKKLKM